MIGILLCYVLYPLSRYLSARFAGASQKFSPPAEGNDSAGWDGGADATRSFTQSQMALLDQSISPTDGSEGEMEEPTPGKEDGTMPGMEEKPAITLLNEDAETVSGSVSQDETGSNAEHRDEEINVLHEVLPMEKVPEDGNISSPGDVSPEEALWTQFTCMKTEDGIQATTSPSHKEVQTSAESVTGTESTSAEIQIPVMETSETAAEAECWDEFVFTDPVDVNYLKLALSAAESSGVSQSGWSQAAELGPCSLWEVPAVSFHPLLQTAVPMEVTWREWEDLGEDAAAAESVPMKKTSVNFTVMSYNILSQDLLDIHPQLYTHCPLEVLDWSYRCSLLLQEIQKWSPDILCLQEVQESHYNEQLQPALSQMGYSCVFKRRTGGKPDGCATCYLSSRFVHTAVTQLEYFRPETGLLDRHNVGLVVLLRPLVVQGSELTESGPPLCVANTHLLFSPRRGDVKLAQLAVMLAEIDRVVKSCRANREQCNVVLCGDFNSVPDTPLYQLITTGRLFYRGLPSWMVSGQENLSHQIHCHRLAPPLWPSALGISSNCQYFPMKKQLQRPEQKSGELQYDHDFMLSLRFCPAACVRPRGLELIPGVTDGSPGGADTQFRSRQSFYHEQNWTATRENQDYEERFGNTISHQLDLESVYKLTPGSRSPDISTLHSAAGAVVDYIFYSPKRAKASGGLKLTGLLPLLSEDVLWAINGLPNYIFPSDHLSLMAKFQLDVNTV